jgi:hypothetical protein
MAPVVRTVVIPPVIRAMIPVRTIVPIRPPMTMTPIATAIVRFLDERVAGFRARLKSGDVVADGCGLRAGRGEAEAKCEGYSEK